MKGEHMDSRSDEALLREQIEALERTGQLGALRDFRQHGKHSVYEHSVQVAAMALKLARKMKLQVDEASLVRGALLHDYFLYDWHDPDPNRPLHGYYHPKAALDNARRDYGVNALEEDIILHHMFPLTPMPPRTKEGMLVCLADKLCATRETVKRG